jgi:hypothetical protein
VIDVEMRAQDNVDRFGRHAGRAQIFEEARVHHVERLATTAILVVAYARVHEERQPGAANDEGMDRL